jgi:hypothetical protein
MLVKSTIQILLALEALNAHDCFCVLWQVAMLSQSQMTSAFMVTYFNRHGFNKLAKVFVFKSLVV